MPRGSEKEKKYKSEAMVVVVAQDLYDETLRLLCKEELFPKKSRWLFARKGEIQQGAPGIKGLKEQTGCRADHYAGCRESL